MRQVAIRECKSHKRVQVAQGKRVQVAQGKRAAKHKAIRECKSHKARELQSSHGEATRCWRLMTWRMTKRLRTKKAKAVMRLTLCQNFGLPKACEVHL